MAMNFVGKKKKKKKICRFIFDFQGNLEEMELLKKANSLMFLPCKQFLNEFIMVLFVKEQECSI